jgi:hypothetical protein
VVHLDLSKIFRVVELVGPIGERSARCPAFKRDVVARFDRFDCTGISDLGVRKIEDSGVALTGDGLISVEGRDNGRSVCQGGIILPGLRKQPRRQRDSRIEDHTAFSSCIRPYMVLILIGKAGGEALDVRRRTVVSVQRPKVLAQLKLLKISQGRDSSAGGGIACGRLIESLSITVAGKNDGTQDFATI